jgi:transcriptional regulator with XRE-family HTH domain
VRHTPHYGGGRVDVSESVRDHPAARERDLAHELRLRVRELIRDTRIAKQLSQSALGEMVGVKRFTIMRYERGEVPVPLRIAERLDQALELTELAPLVRRLHGLDGTTETERDLVVQRMLLDTQGLESVTLALTDDLDVFELIYEIGQNRPRLDAREVRVIFPSIERERQLFGGQPLYAHVERQIKRLADLQDSESRPYGTLQIFESDDILASCVIARTRTGTECAYWPPLPVGGKVDGRTLPVTSSIDPNTTGRVEEYVKQLLAGRDSLRSNEALCRVDASAPTEPQFTRYFSLGTDQEEDVADDEGFAVALVLAIALCPRAHHGLARRIVTCNRPSARRDRERLSLFSNNVDDADIRTARSIDAGSPPQVARSTRGALAAALDINDYLTARAGMVPDLAFQLAAAREFAMFGLEVAPERLRPVAMPAPLQLIKKPKVDDRRRACVAPRVFTLELDPTGEVPELDRLGTSADIEVVGIDDLAESTSLNSFLHQARDCGFLVPWLSDMGLARR